jgi:CRP-like cAMP-binding protein
MRGTPREYGAGEVIFLEYEMGGRDVCGARRGGRARDRVAGSSKTLSQGEPFGEMALIDQSAPHCHCDRKTACKVAVIPERRFLFLVQTDALVCSRDS